MSLSPNTSVTKASNPPFFVLASGSPRRREFMALLQVPFAVITPAATGITIDETPQSQEKPAALVQRLSQNKAKTVAKALPRLERSAFGLPARHPQQTFAVLAADTIVVLADKILGKPDSPADAVAMLKLLRQKPHFVYSGLTINLVDAQGQTLYANTRLHQSQVHMRPYTNAEIDAYVAGGDPLDKAGAYGIQNKTFAPVAQLQGCFASVMGFPLGELAAALQETGINLPPIGPLCATHTHHPCCQK